MLFANPYKLALEAGFLAPTRFPFAATVLPWELAERDEVVSVSVLINWLVARAISGAFRKAV